MSLDNPLFRQQARHHFEEARRQARRAELAARLTGRDSRLLPFETIRAQLRQQNPMYQGAQSIEIAKIAGSVGRYQEFTREFMPLNDSLRERWTKIEALAVVRGWPPVEVYKVGDVYFVKDGNHRVSVARQMGNDTIEAHVWEYPTDIEIGHADSLDQILIRLGERNFLAQTHLDEIVPDHNIRFTSPGRYSELMTQIQTLRETLSVIDDRPMPADEAVAAWYEMIYLPVVQIIHDSQLLQQFPGRTEVDLFAWLSKHRDQLEAYYGEFENLEELARLLAQKYREGGVGKVTRQIRRMLGQDALPPLQEEPLEETELRPTPPTSDEDA